MRGHFETLKTVLLVGVALVLVMACDSSGNGSGEQTFDLSTVSSQIMLNVDYLDVSIESFGTDFYYFDAPSSGTYEIRVTGISVNGDMGWELYDRAVISLSTPPIAWRDFYLDNTDEVLSVALSIGRYYLVVDEWLDPGSTVQYDLRVNSP